MCMRREWTHLMRSCHILYCWCECMTVSFMVFCSSFNCQFCFSCSLISCISCSLWKIESWPTITRILCATYSILPTTILPTILGTSYKRQIPAVLASMYCISKYLQWHVSWTYTYSMSYMYVIRELYTRVFCILHLYTVVYQIGCKSKYSIV